MDTSQFNAMVARLERESARAPRRYQVRVGLLALAGFALLAAIMGVAGLGLLLMAGLAVAAIATGGGALILLLKLGKVLLLLAVPLWFLIKASLSALFTRLPPPQGQEIIRQQAPALFQAMDRMRERMQGPRFHHVLITDEVNAAVVQRPLFGLVGWPRNYLILGLPLLEGLSPDEALAVVAHEYGHLAGAHSRFAAFIYRLRNTWGTIQAVAGQWSGWLGRRLQAVVGWYAPYFNAYTFVLARAHEYQADAASAELVGAEVAASALKRVNVVAAQHDTFMERTFAGVREDAAPPRDIASRWARHAADPLPAGQAVQWLERALARAPHVLDTHPALGQRLAALGHGAQGEPPAPIAGPTAAAAWLGRHVGVLRQHFQQAWHDQVAHPWGERHQEAQADRRRLQELDALPAPAPDEQLERLRLRLRLLPDDDHLPALAAFNDAHADHPVGLFLEGDLRLKAGDEGGLALLDRAMALDPQAIKPASELAWRHLLAQGRAELAESYADRWKRRHEWEERRAGQLGALDLKHDLRPADDLSAADRRRAGEILRREQAGLKRAWLARRVLPADPTVPTYVLVLELTWWARLRGHQSRAVDRLVRHEWPVHLIVCVAEKNLKSLARRVRRLDGAELPLAG